MAYQRLENRTKQDLEPWVWQGGLVMSVGHRVGFQCHAQRRSEQMHFSLEHIKPFLSNQRTWFGGGSSHCELNKNQASKTQ